MPKNNPHHPLSPANIALVLDRLYGGPLPDGPLLAHTVRHILETALDCGVVIAPEAPAIAAVKGGARVTRP